VKKKFEKERVYKKKFYINFKQDFQFVYKTAFDITEKECTLPGLHDKPQEWSLKNFNNSLQMSPT